MPKKIYKQKRLHRFQTEDYTDSEGINNRCNQNSNLCNQSISFRIAQHPILTFPKGRLVKFFFEEKEIEGYEGEPIAAALIANGIKVFRITEKMKRPRGFFCAVGKCSSCLMEVDSRPNVMVCVEPLKEGMKVTKQTGRGKLE
jgi:hypothetical protein